MSKCFSCVCIPCIFSLFLMYCISVHVFVCIITNFYNKYNRSTSGKTSVGYHWIKCLLNSLTSF